MNFVLSKEKGFTLVEIVIAVSIVLVLLTVVMTNVQDARKKSRDAQRLSDIDQISLALRMYLDSYGAYPPNATDGSLSALSVLVPNFLPSIPNDPLRNGGTPVWNGTNQDSYFYWGPTGVGPCGGSNAYTLWYRLESEADGNAEAGCNLSENNTYTRHP